MRTFLNSVKTEEDFENPDNYCLLLTVDDGNSANNKLINEGKETFGHRDYLKESFRCIAAWRKRGGYLKDISIIVDYVGESPMTEETINFYKLHKVRVFQRFDETHKKMVSNFAHGFVNVHITGLEFNTIGYGQSMKPITIHIDLDMELLQPIQPSFFYPLLDHACIVGGYRKEDLQNQRFPLFGRELLNTDLIITKYIPYNKYEEECYIPDIPATPTVYGYNHYNTGEYIYKSIVNSCMNIALNYEDYQKRFYQENMDINYGNIKFREFDIEEYGADEAYAQHMRHIEDCKEIPESELDPSDIGIQPWYIVREDSYEQGEGYFEIKDLDANKVYFWHEHILDKPNEYFTKQKVQLVNAIMRAKLKAIHPEYPEHPEHLDVK